MRRLGLLVASLLAASGCSGGGGGTESDAGVHQSPISIISNPQSFRPASLVLDFNQNIVAAPASEPVLEVLDPCTLSVDQVSPVPEAPSPWINPQLALGSEANGYLYFGTGAFFAVNLATDTVAPLVDAGRPLFLDDGGLIEVDAGPAPADAGPAPADAGSAPADAGALEVDAGPVVVTWTPRLDAPGVVYADTTGAVYRTDGEGVVNLAIPPAGDRVEAIASSIDGHILVLGSTDGACNIIRSQPQIGTGPLMGTFGSSPCFIGIPNQAGADVWVVGQTNGGAQVVALRAAELIAQGSPTVVSGITPTAMVLAVDGSAIALLGLGPMYSVATGLTSDIVQNLQTGEQGPWRLASLVELPSATGGLFDDSGALYVADPVNSSIDIVQ